MVSTASLVAVYPRLSGLTATFEGVNRVFFAHDIILTEFFNKSSTFFLKKVVDFGFFPMIGF